VMAVDVAEFKPGTLSDFDAGIGARGSALLALLLALPRSGASRLGWPLPSRRVAAAAARQARVPREHGAAVARGLSGALPTAPRPTSGGAGQLVVGARALSVALVARELDLPILLLAAASALMVADFCRS
jgi:hypothetical protein